MKKYELTEETTTLSERTLRGISEHTLHRIRAVRSFGDVKEGDIGGWIEKEENLSHEGNCWVRGSALLCGNAKLRGNAEVRGFATVH